MDNKVNQDIWRNGFRFFGNYAAVIYRIGDEEKEGKFLRAIYRYMFFDEEPDFEEMTDEWMDWRAILPNLESSKKRAINGAKAKGKGTGPRPSMNGNQNARKSDEDANLDDL